MSVLEKPCLVLNRNWQPVNVATVMAALVMLWKGNAKVVDVSDYQAFGWNDWSKISPKEGEEFIQSTSIALRIPEVIVLTEYGGLPETQVVFSRRNLFKRDHYQCQYCLKNLPAEELTIDHVIPRSAGGISSYENCVAACVKCNKAKDNKSLKESGLSLRRKPVTPKWKPLYASRIAHPDSWDKFLSEVYWNIELRP